MVGFRALCRGRRWVLVLLFLACLAVMGRLAYRDEVVGRDRPIVLDDFAFTVRDVRIAEEPSDRARSMVVSLEITNRARRVSFTFDPGWALLVDARGVERPISRPGQRRHDQRDPTRSPVRGPIKAGESAVVDLVFDAPPETAGSQFRLSSGGPIGDFLDGFFSGPRRIALDP